MSVNASMDLLGQCVKQVLLPSVFKVSRLKVVKFLFMSNAFMVYFEQCFSLIDINDCASFPCANGGVCMDLEDGYECECLIGFTGPVCETGNEIFDSSEEV